jgi:hypothetical protein
MKMRSTVFLVMPILLCTMSVMAGDSQPPRVQGRVVELTDARGFDQLTILTTGGERMQVRLGEAGTCRGLVSSGDQVRLRLVVEKSVDGASLAMGMKVRRTGASYRFRNGAGDMNQQWTQTRARDGSCGGTPGDGCQNPKCPGAGSGGQGGGQRGGGGSRGGGSGGGGGGARGGGGGSCGGGR